MPITDSLENARRLEAMGFTHEQAHGLAEMLEQSSGAARADLATRDDLHVIATELRAEIRSAEERLRAELHRELRMQMLWFFTMLVGVVGIAVAVIKLFP